jgi:hypothetical protein
MTQLSNWGRWSKDDQKGTINLLTPERRKQALAAAREGMSISLSHTYIEQREADATSPFSREMLPIGTGDFVSDRYSVSFHGYAHSHMVSCRSSSCFPGLLKAEPRHCRSGDQLAQSMVKHLLEAFSFDIHIRRDVDEKYSPDGIRVIATDIREGMVHEANGVKVSAFFVDHGPVKPAFGYRVDYHGHSVVISGDTKPSESLVKFSQNVDVLPTNSDSRRRILA